MGLLRMAARTAVVAGTATAVSGRVAAPPGRQVRPAGPAAVRAAAVRPAAAVRAAAPPRRPAEDDPIAQLAEVLAKLHEQGVLTDEEFAAAKAKILGI